MGEERGTVFYQLDGRRFPSEEAGVALKYIALLVNGTNGDGSVAAFDLRAGIRRGEGDVYWVGFNSQYWGCLFEVVLIRYGVPVHRSSALPGGDQPILRRIASRRDVRRILNAPLTDDEEKASTVDEALDMLSHVARGAWRRRRRR